MLKLLIKDTTVQSSTVAVSWCLEKRVIDKLNQRLTLQKDEGLYLLLVVAPKPSYAGGHRSYRETRKLVPITDPFAYVDFRHPGENNIFAIMVWGKESRLHDRFISRHDSWHGTDVLWSDGVTVNEHFTKFLAPPGFLEGITASIAVQVPEECFAKEPPEWEKTWVNYWFRGQSLDQCDYRRRRLVAYTIQPVLFAIKYLIGALCILVLMLCGMRNIGYGFLAHPIQYAVDDIWYRLSGSIFFPRKSREERWRLLLVPLTPLICLLAGFLGVYLSMLLSNLGHNLGHLGLLERCLLGIGTLYAVYYGIALLIGVAVALTSVCVFCAAMITAGYLRARAWLGKIFAFDAKPRPVVETAPQEKPVVSAPPPPKPKPVLLSEQAVMDLVCSTGPKPMSLRELPKRRRTVRLRFQNLKAQVCRPFRG